MKIVFLDQATITLQNDIDFTPFSALGDYVAYANSNEQKIVERAGDAEIIIVNKAPITAKVISQLPRLKLVTVIATGYNNIDLHAAEKKGITVCNVAGYATTSVPQHTFALLLNLATRTCQYNSDIQQGAWQKAETFTLLTYPTFELADKVIGIIGFGNIGRGVARIAEAFDMKVMVYSQSLPNSDPRKAELDTLLRESDIVSVHCPLTPKTENLIDAPEISRMKPGAVIINTARGGVVNEAALAEALNAGHLAGAACDVLTEEPPRNGNVLFGAKNLILTPHSAWSTREARQRLVAETAANIQAFLQGKKRNVLA